MEATIEEQLIARVRTLSPAEQQQILNQLQTVPHTPTPPGTPGKEAARFAGLFPPEDAEVMLRASEECRGIDYKSWGLPTPTGENHHDH